jgi:hypothetical protein
VEPAGRWAGWASDGRGGSGRGARVCVLYLRMADLTARSWRADRGLDAPLSLT